jgi:hypothetical protein
MKYDMKRAVFLPGTMPMFPVTRTKWPFKEMNVGDEVVFTDNIDKSRVMAHTYGASAGKKFVTRRNGGSLHVYRVA